MSKPAQFSDLDKAIKDMLKAAQTFEERKQSIDTAIKFEMLRIKAKGGKFGSGFTDPEGDDDEDN